MGVDMPSIHVDEQVMSALKARANGRTPNEVVRELLGLPTDQPRVAQPAVYLVPHSSKEFDDAEDLANWLSTELLRDGVYLVASTHYWRNVTPDSVCLLHKDKLIVGEGRLNGGLQQYRGRKTSPVTGAVFAGELDFDPASIRVYPKPVSFEQTERLLGKTLTWRGLQRLTTEDYARIRTAAS